MIEDGLQWLGREGLTGKKADENGKSREKDVHETPRITNGDENV